MEWPTSTYRSSLSAFTISFTSAAGPPDGSQTNEIPIAPSRGDPLQWCEGDSEARQQRISKNGLNRPRNEEKQEATRQSSLYLLRAN
jgi:hypothetical protein